MDAQTSCPICGRPRRLKNRTLLKTCGDPDCVNTKRGRAIKTWYASPPGRALVAKRMPAYVWRVSAEVDRVITELAGTADMIPRQMVRRMCARLRQMGYLRGYNVGWGIVRRAQRRVS